MKMQENEKILKTTDKNTIFDNRTVEISSERPGNYPKCMLSPRCQFGLDLSI